MHLDEYQTEALRTADFKDPKEAMTAAALGLAGEAGEVIELIKKHLFHGHSLNRLDVQKEIGDVLWYAAVLAEACGISLDIVAKANVEKLKERYPEGFTHERSINRVVQT